MSLSESLIKMRQAVNLSQKEVSELLGYSTPQFISNWERGVSCPPIASVKKIAKIYKTDANELFNSILETHIDEYRQTCVRKYVRSK